MHCAKHHECTVPGTVAAKKSTLLFRSVAGTQERHVFMQKSRLTSAPPIMVILISWRRPLSALRSFPASHFFQYFFQYFFHLQLAPWVPLLLSVAKCSWPPFLASTGTFRKAFPRPRADATLSYLLHQNYRYPPLTRYFPDLFSSKRFEDTSSSCISLGVGYEVFATSLEFCFRLPSAGALSSDEPNAMPIGVSVEPCLDSSPPSPSYDALLLATIIQRCRAGRTGPSLRLLESVHPHHAPSSPTLATARDALLAAGPFIFPIDTPQFSSESDSESDSDADVEPDSATDSENFQDVHVEAPPLQLTPTASTSPAKSTYLDPTAQLDHAMERSRTLPLSSTAVYDALVEPVSQMPSNISSEPRGFEVVAENESPRRANSLPRRPNSSPPPRLRSLGLPGYSRNGDTSSTESKELMTRDPRAHSKLSRRFRHILLESKSHVFAITTRNGTRQYVYCRPITTNHTLVVVSRVSFSAVYISALEHTAARYVLLVDEGSVEERQAGRQMSESTRFLTLQLMRCPAEVAKILVRNLCEWLKPMTGSFNQSEKCCSLLRRARLRFVRDDVDADCDGKRRDATFLTSSSTSSGSSMGLRDGIPRRLSTTTLLGLSYEKEYIRFFAKRNAGSSGNTGLEGVEMHSFPWEIYPTYGDIDILSVLTRVSELADATILFQHFASRAIVSVVVALLEERRVCIVGPSTATVSRAVIAFENLLRPFEWPHLLSPILLEHMLPVLGAPFPFLVGILSSHADAARELPLDEVVFVSLETGKITSTQDSAFELHRRIPRKLRIRFERRLLRARNASLRQVNRATAFPFMPSISNTASSYFEDRLYSPMANRMRSSGLWRSKSQLRLYNESNPQNVWLDCETCTSLDKCMRKFYAELLNDFHSIREMRGIVEVPERGENASRIVPGSAKFSSLLRDMARQELVKSFCGTQMFMHWEGLESADITFGTCSSEAPYVKKGTSRRERMLASRHLAATGKSLIYDESSVDVVSTSDMECCEEIRDDFMVNNLHEVSIRKSTRNKKLRFLENRLQFSSDAEEFGTENSDMQSDVEQDVMDKEMVPIRSVEQNASTECIPDVETSLMAKPTKQQKRSGSRARRRRHSRKDFLMDVESRMFVRDNVRSIPRMRRRNASTDCIPDIEPGLPIARNGRPKMKQHRRTASTDCASNLHVHMSSRVFARVTDDRLPLEGPVPPDVDELLQDIAEMISVNPSPDLTVSSYSRETEKYRLSKRPTALDQGHFRNFAETDTEIESALIDGTEDTDDNAHISPSDEDVRGKNGARAWGQRQVSHFSRVY